MYVFKERGHNSQGDQSVPVARDCQIGERPPPHPQNHQNITFQTKQ